MGFKDSEWVNQQTANCYVIFGVSIRWDIDDIDCIDWTRRDEVILYLNLQPLHLTSVHLQEVGTVLSSDLQ